MYKNDKLPDLRAISLEKGRIIAEERFQRLLKIMYDTVDEETSKFFKDIASVMNKVDKPNLPGFENVHWNSLSQLTIRRKGHNRKWFSNIRKSTGAVSLMSFLKQARVDLYYPKPKYAIKSWKNSYGRMKRLVVAYPSMYYERDKTFDTYDQNYENPKTQEVKVTSKNPVTGYSNEEMRPLFAPMSEYYLRHKIPLAINAKLRENGFKIAKFERFNWILRSPEGD